jgi:Bax protein
MTIKNIKRSAVLALITLAILPAQSALMGDNEVTAAPRVVFNADHADAAYLNKGVANVAPRPTELASVSSDSLQEAAEESATTLHKRFVAMGYELDLVREGDAPVPRVSIAALPEDLHAIRQVELKKSVFFKTTLPLILMENEKIAADRQKLLRLVDVLREGRDLDPAEAVWLTRLAQRYNADVDDWDTLMARVDEIPVSLAMAQAAEESGWGTSRFAQNGNALFGQWTTADDEGLIPKDRKEGMTHKVKAFDSLSDSVAGYMRNLNTHGAYKLLRAERATMRKQGINLNGWHLAGALTEYSERGEKYVKSIRLIIDANDLRELDAAAQLASIDGEQEA